MKFIYMNEYCDLTVTLENDEVVRIEFGKDDDVSLCENAAALNVTSQLDEYFEGKRREFSFPYKLKVSDFQRQVLVALMNIEYNSTCSYSDIAEKINKPTACRAVANAIARNPLPILIPCHRVLRKSGELGGFRGGVELKKLLLGIEGEIEGAKG